MLAMHFAFIANSSWVAYDGDRNVRDEEHRVEQEQKARERSFIRELVPDWRPTRRQVVWATRVAILLVITLFILTLIGLPFGITLWAWLNLLVVPAVLAAGGIWFNQQQRKRELETASKQREHDLKIAEQRAQDEVLHAYLDQMSQLMLDKNGPLRLSKEGDEARTLARARTITVLSRVGGERKARVLQFLHEAGLIDSSCVVLDLTGVSLERIDWVSANLSGASLTKTDLSNAQLILANLATADLRMAKLDEADLSGANLDRAKLRGATLIWSRLGYAQLNGADLSGQNLLEDPHGADRPDNWIGADLGANLPAELHGADLRGAKLRGANLEMTNLTEAVLSEADLSGANLSYADLVATDLTGATLSGANLEGAMLVGADLRGATGWTVEQLMAARTLEGSGMPDGQILKSRHTSEGPTFEEWLNSKGRGEDEENNGPS